MNFSAWSIRNPIAPILGFMILMVLGWQAFNALPITRFPNIDVPLVAVSISQAGAAPAELESQVTKEIEDAIAGITGVKNVTSSITDGGSTTVAEFNMDVPTDKAVQDVKDAIDQIRGSLPGDIEAPIVTRIDVEGQAIMTFAVSSPNMSIEELSWFVDDSITRAMQGRPGVGRVDRYGGAEREIRIELDPVRLDSFGITAAAVSAQIRQTNTDLGAGRSELGEREQAIRLLGDASSAEKLANTTIGLASGRFVKLSELGTITDTYEELRSFSRFNGDPVVTFAVYRAKGASEVSVSEVVNTALEKLRAANPQVTITPVDDTVFYTLGNYHAAIDTLLEGALLAVIVVMLFLRNWRATLITAVALPLSAIPTFYIMDMLDFSLNLVSFLAITLATGILVDDAIVEIENIARHIRMGKTPYRAAIEAADEIGLAVIATTFTIIAVFIPVSFMPGIPGQYFRQFGITVAVAVGFSLLVARLITPMMAAYLMRAKDAEEHHQADGLVMRGYLATVWFTLLSWVAPLPRFLVTFIEWLARGIVYVLRTAAVLVFWLPARLFGTRLTLFKRLPVLFTRIMIPNYYLTLAAAFGILIISVNALLSVPGSFIPPEDASRIPLSIELPPGSTLQDTDRVTQQITRMVENVDGVAGVLVIGGSSPTGDRDIRRASVTIVLDKLEHSLLYKFSEIGHNLPLIGPYIPLADAKGRTRPQFDIEAEILADVSAIPDVRILKLGDRGARDITFSILSTNDADLNTAVARLEGALRGDPLLANVSTEGALPRPEVQITPKLEQAARLGITTAQIAETVRVATIGDFDASLAKVSIDNRLIPVRVQLRGDLKTDIGRLGALKLTTRSGATVPLNAVADIRIAEGPNTISRLNRERIATIGANLPPGVALNTATDRFKEIAATVTLPPTVRIAESGDAEIQAELMGSFVNAMILGLMLVLTVLILLFKSVIQPFTILFSLPLAIGGVAAALILTNNPLSMPVLIGILMLMGIVTKNAILLVDFAIEMIHQGMSRKDALIEAGHKRARPIVMTSIAMSVGMLPSAIGVGEGGAFRAPMATAVIGGIIVSTVLSLVVVPSFFLIMDDLSWLLGKIFGGLVGKKEAEPVAPEALELAQTIDETRSEVAALRERLSAVETANPRRPVAVAGTQFVAE